MTLSPLYSDQTQQYLVTHFINVSNITFPSCKTTVERVDIDIIDSLQLFIHLMKSAKPLIKLLSRNAE